MENKMVQNWMSLQERRQKVKAYECNWNDHFLLGAVSYTESWELSVF